MSTLARALVLGLLLVACLQLSVMGQNANEPKECCFKFFEKPIRARSITTYGMTRPECPKAGVIFTTRKGLRICADPGFKWVRNAMDRIDQRLVEEMST
uniref:C-C motif chemokine n=1 Tax=Electrophorus electricus TaxID=8005 RepID=A0A4W4DMX8_ELEEL